MYVALFRVAFYVYLDTIAKMFIKNVIKFQ